MLHTKHRDGLSRVLAPAEQGQAKRGECDDLHSRGQSQDAGEAVDRRNLLICWGSYVGGKEREDTPHLSILKLLQNKGDHRIQFPFGHGHDLWLQDLPPAPQP